MPVHSSHSITTFPPSKWNPQFIHFTFFAIALRLFSATVRGAPVERARREPTAADARQPRAEKVLGTVSCLSAMEVHNAWLAPGSRQPGRRPRPRAPGRGAAAACPG